MVLNEKQQKYINYKLDTLSKSKFRSSFSLKKKDREYALDKGIALLEEHAFALIEKRLGSSSINNDGKQTPMRGHPVFVAQHATATCCRGCLEKWHHIGKGKDLEEREIKFIVALIIQWIKKDISR